MEETQVFGEVSQRGRCSAVGLDFVLKQPPQTRHRPSCFRFCRVPCFPQADKKHVIPGMDEHEPERRIRPHPECDKMGLSHKDGFQDLPPCRNGRDQKLTRQSLASCLWSTSELCVQSMTSVDPDVRR